MCPNLCSLHEGSLLPRHRAQARCSRAEKLQALGGIPAAMFLSHTLHFASLHRCHHINIPVTIAYCQTQFRKVPVCYKYFIVLEYAIYVTCPAKEIHYTVLSD